MTIEILPAAERHKGGIRDLILPIQQNEFKIPITYDDQPDLQNIENAYRKGAGEFWVALADEEVVGTIALIDIGDRQAALRKMFVRADHRGKAAGVAGRLLQTLLAHAARQDFKEVYLGTTASFLAAHRFYEKTGFKLIEETGLPDSFPKMAVDTRFYRYDVSPLQKA